MPGVTSSQIRNVVLLSHGGAGKTTLVDALAFATGATTRQGRVEDGTSVADFDAEEHDRGMSINLAVVSLDHAERRINLIDTPGYADFVGEMIAGTSVADAALIVVDAAAGVQVGTEAAWRMADGRTLPRAVVINRMDRENADWEKTLTEVQGTLGPQCQPLFLPIGSEHDFSGIVDVLGGKVYRESSAQASAPPEDMADAVTGARELVIERIAEANDDLTLKYLEGETLTEEEITSGLKEAILAGTLVPVMPAAGALTIGSAPLLTLISEEFPSPLDAPAIEAKVDGKTQSLTADPSTTPAALIFKTTADEFVGRLTYLRVFSGTVQADSHLFNTQKQQDERLANLSHVFGKELQSAGALVAGDIGAVTKLNASTTFDTLSDKAHPIILTQPALPTPVFSAAITPKTKADVDKLGTSLHRLVEEDLTLQIDRDADTGETILSGLGESHVQLASEKLHRKFHVDVDVHDRRIPYRETITKMGSAEYLHKKQTGGHGQYARVALRVEPLERGDGVEFSAKVVGGSVPRQYIPAVEKGVAESVQQGALAHYPLTDVRVVLYDGKHHDVDSSEMAFKVAASMALKEATQVAHPILLEPIMSMRILAPESATGDVMSDLNGRRARVQGMEPATEGNGLSTVLAEAPMAEIQHYATYLRSMTGGRGTFSAEFARYDPVPEHVAKKVTEAANAVAEVAG